MTRRGRGGSDLWAEVKATVTPLRGRPVSLETLTPPVEAPPPPPKARAMNEPRASALPPRRPPALQAPQLHAIEPRRLRRIGRGGEEIAGRIDLHGHTQAGAHAALVERVLRLHVAGARAVLVITGKGLSGDGILRRRVPQWLAEPPLRAVVAGISPAGRSHGGAGALYVALRRRERGA
jgi:DNA-nicking Smr family endonuclease